MATGSQLAYFMVTSFAICKQKQNILFQRKMTPHPPPHLPRNKVGGKSMGGGRRESRDTKGVGNQENEGKMAKAGAGIKIPLSLPLARMQGSIEISFVPRIHEACLKGIGKFESSYKEMGASFLGSEYIQLLIFHLSFLGAGMQAG